MASMHVTRHVFVVSNLHAPKFFFSKFFHFFFNFFSFFVSLCPLFWPLPPLSCNKHPTINPISGSFLVKSFAKASRLFYFFSCLFIISIFFLFIKFTSYRNVSLNTFSCLHFTETKSRLKLTKQNKKKKALLQCEDKNVVLNTCALEKLLEVRGNWKERKEGKNSC